MEPSCMAASITWLFSVMALLGIVVPRDLIGARLDQVDRLRRKRASNLKDAGVAGRSQAAVSSGCAAYGRRNVDLPGLIMATRGGKRMIKLNTMMVAAMAVIPTAALGQEASPASERQAVEAVLSQYKTAIERLDANGTEELFTTDSQIFETGGSEGSYTNYLSHHLGPELGHFRSFKFSDYKVDVRFEGPVALATETYRYRIEPKSGEAAERLGVATSVLKKFDGRWRIISIHNSARRPKGS